MRRLIFVLFLVVGLAGCSWIQQTPTKVSPSPTSETLPPISTASIPIPATENDSPEHGGDEQDFEFDIDGAMLVVEKVTTALEDGDWDTLFTFISSSHASHMTAEEFGSVMSVQEDQLGEIVKVEILSVPELLPDESDHVMFTVEVAVTHQKGEETQVNHYLDYYVLEEGEWRVEKSAQN